LYWIIYSDMALSYYWCILWQP